jgi:hypothetical protein
VDWTGDGLLDVLIGGRDGQVRLYQGLPTDDIPLLTRVSNIQAGGTTIDVGNNSAPCVVDWNEDGLPDLLVGAEGSSTGTIATLRLYLNSGTPTSPVLTTYSYVEYNGTDITEYRCTPHVADINDDGKKDLVTGNWDGYTNYYENTGTNSAPVFMTQEKLTYVSGTPIDVYYSCRPFMIDWDEDGIIDLLAGNYYGNAGLYLGQLVGVGGSSGEASGYSTSLAVAGSPTQGGFQLLFGLASTQTVTVEVFDLSGRLVHSQVPGLLTAGQHALFCDLGGNPPGVYIARLITNEGCPTASIVLTD